MYKNFSNFFKSYSLLNSKITLNIVFKNITFCQKGCSYAGMNYELMTANCICDSSFLQSSSVNNNTNFGNKNNEEDNNTFKTLTKSFISNLFNFNFDIFKCYNLVFNLQKLRSNIGFYSMVSMFSLQIIFLFVFLIKRLNPLKMFMQIFNNYNQKLSLSSPAPKNNNSNSNINMLDNNSKEHKIIETHNKKIKISLNKIKEKKQINFNDGSKYIKTNSKTKYSNKYSNNSSNNKETINYHQKINEKVKYDNNIYNIVYKNNIAPTFNFKKSLLNISSKKYLHQIKLETFKFTTQKKEINSESSKIKHKLYKIKTNNKTTFYKKIDLCNMETIEEKNKNKIILRKNQDVIKLLKADDNLQDMNYEQAILYDKRNYFRMYWSFLVDKQIILGTFCTENYLTLFVIKLSFLVYTFQISFFLNAFFYTEEYISDAYHNDGILDFFSGLPKSIYSLIATMIITNLLNILSNSKSDLMYIIRQKSKNKNYIHLVNRKLKQLRNKLIIYFILVFLLGTMFLYYICSFCSVYHYSQKYWFIGCLESFGIDSLMAIIICLFLALFRYLAIKKHLKCVYIIANVISSFL